MGSFGGMGTLGGDLGSSKGIWGPLGVMGTLGEGVQPHKAVGPYDTGHQPHKDVGWGWGAMGWLGGHWGGGVLGIFLGGFGDP